MYYDDYDFISMNLNIILYYFIIGRGKGGNIAPLLLFNKQFTALSKNSFKVVFTSPQTVVKDILLWIIFKTASDSYILL